ncbi:MAG: EndoU domain-containing protein [Gaiellaceae bacterium]
MRAYDRLVVFAMVGWLCALVVASLASATTTRFAIATYGYDRAAPNAQSARESIPLLSDRTAVPTSTESARQSGDGRFADFLAAEEGAIDLTTPAARSQILEGEARSNGTFAEGHRPGTGFPGKSDFPSGWSDDRIIHEIFDVATDPASTAVQQGSRTIVTGTRSGVTIRVVIDNKTGEIVTGYPTNLSRNP